MAWPKVIASAHLKVMVNGRLLGWAAGFRPRISTPVRKAQGIDTNLTFELMPATYDVSGTIQVLRGRAQGGAEGLGMAAFAKDLLKQKYCSIELLDRLSDQVVMKFVGCLITEQTWDVSPKGIVTGQFTFEGLDYSNEAEAA
jgi:hypothetical protein